MVVDNKYLNMIIDITRQRDIDSLEYTLIKSLSEIFPDDTVSIYRPFNGIYRPDDGLFRITLSDKNVNHDITGEEVLVVADDQLNQCFQSATIITNKTNQHQKHLLYPLLIDKKVAGALQIDYQNDFSRYKKKIAPLIDICSNHLSILNEAERDKLTGLLNRRTFDSRLNKLLNAQRSKQDFYLASDKNTHRNNTTDKCPWLAMLDIDHFKKVNDKHGHLFGDEVILILSQQMKNFFRYTDLLFRFGGEEFVIVLEPISPVYAKQTLERFCKSISNYVFPQIGQVTISIGYAKVVTNQYPHNLVERADKALYYAKEHGRNCVYNYEELLESGDLIERKADDATIFF